MKITKVFLLSLLIAFFINNESRAQIVIQYGLVSNSEGDVNVIPRYSWGGFSYLPINDTKFVAGMVLENQGLIFDQGADRVVHRGIGIGPTVGIDLPIGEKYFARLAYVPEIFLHYKHKMFLEKKRSNKVVLHKEWFSDRMNWFNHSVDFAIGHRFLALNLRYFFNDLLNKDYTAENDVKPFENIDSKMFNIGITWNFIRADEEEEPDEEMTKVFY